jgi:hypothetical protein
MEIRIGACDPLGYTDTTVERMVPQAAFQSLMLPNMGLVT